MRARCEVNAWSSMILVVVVYENDSCSIGWSKDHLGRHARGTNRSKAGRF